MISTLNSTCDAIADNIPISALLLQTIFTVIHCHSIQFFSNIFFPVKDLLPSLASCSINLSGPLQISVSDTLT